MWGRTTADMSRMEVAQPWECERLSRLGASKMTALPGGVKFLSHPVQEAPCYNSVVYGYNFTGREPMPCQTVGGATTNYRDLGVEKEYKPPDDYQ